MSEFEIAALSKRAGQPAGNSDRTDGGEPSQLQAALPIDEKETCALAVYVHDFASGISGFDRPSNSGMDNIGSPFAEFILIL